MEKYLERAEELKESVAGNYEHSTDIQDCELVEWLIKQAEKAQLLEQQLKRFEYLASYEYSHQIDNVKGNKSKYQQGALEGMENYNRKWKEATGRKIEAMW
ncbi:hypothetical protein MKY04_12695 [Lysinibacillus telephonicus]|uniref:hypothetical protein n=1 Tax=Lysinibacillus telephonicus TaxID=1714840 RepID=UPI0031FDEFF6